MNITDEMVEKAHKHTCLRREWCRQVIEAVAPMLIAQGMREAAEIAAYSLALHDAVRRVHERAQELDPK